MKNETPKPLGQSGLFLSTVSALNNGEALQELDAALHEATKATSDLGGKAKVTLTLTIKQGGTGVGDVPLVALGFDVSKKIPKKFTKDSTFFVTEDGAPSRRNPDQSSLSLEEIRGMKDDSVSPMPSARAQGE
jgi:hypothetical protein